MVYLVAGGAGFVGSHIVDRLLGDGHFVRVFDDLSFGHKNNLDHHVSSKRFEFIRGDIRDVNAVVNALVGVDVVFHLATVNLRASLMDSDYSLDVNFNGTRHLLDLSVSEGVKSFVYFSSAEVYGRQSVVSVHEGMRTFPTNVYGVGKLAAESYVRAVATRHRLPFVILRPFNGYGPRCYLGADHLEMVPSFVTKILDDKPLYIFGDGQQFRSLTYISDYVDAFMGVLENKCSYGQTINVGSPRRTSVRHVAEQILAIMGKDQNYLEFHDNRESEIGGLCPDLALFSSLLSWSNSVCLRDGLQLTVDWLSLQRVGTCGV